MLLKISVFKMKIINKPVLLPPDARQLIGVRNREHTSHTYTRFACVKWLAELLDLYEWRSESILAAAGSGLINYATVPNGLLLGHPFWSSESSRLSHINISRLVHREILLKSASSLLLA